MTFEVGSGLSIGVILATVILVAAMLGIRSSPG